jgi:acetate kinase
MLSQPVERLRLVICHLGHGCSATAKRRGGRSIVTTMGFTSIDGLTMATRSGSIDPDIMLHVQQRPGLGAGEVEHALNRALGLLRVSGVSSDMRAVLAAAGEGREHARLALAVYAHRVRQAIGALTVTVGGLDAPGVGGHVADAWASSSIRAPTRRASPMRMWPGAPREPASW